MKLVVLLMQSTILCDVRIAPPLVAELLIKLFTPLKINTTFFADAPPLYPAELLLKLLVPMNINEILHIAKIAPPPYTAELPLNLFVPLKVTFSCDTIAPPKAAELLMKLFFPWRISKAFLVM